MIVVTQSLQNVKTKYETLRGIINRVRQFTSVEKTRLLVYCHPTSGNSFGKASQEAAMSPSDVEERSSLGSGATRESGQPFKKGSKSLVTGR
jgi:hypothetical protein